MSCFKFIIHLSELPAKIIFLSGNLVVFLFSFVGNGIVIFVVVKKPHLKTPTYCLLAALALSDFITAIFGQFIYCIEVAFKNYTSCEFDKAIAFFNASSCGTGMLLLCAIAHDRFLRVSKAMQYDNHTSLKRVCKITLSSAFIGMVIAGMFLFGANVASTVGFAILGASCFTFICILSRRIHHTVQNHNQAFERSLRGPVSFNLEADGHRVRRFNSAVEKAVNLSLFAVISLFFCAWFPVIVLMIIFTVYRVQHLPVPDKYRFAFTWCSSVSFFNGALNPVFYSYRCDAIGREIKKIVRNLLCRKQTIVPMMPEISRLELSGRQRSVVTVI